MVPVVGLCNKSVKKHRNLKYDDSYCIWTATISQSPLVKIWHGGTLGKSWLVTGATDRKSLGTTELGSFVNQFFYRYFVNGFNETCLGCHILIIGLYVPVCYLAYNCMHCEVLEWKVCFPWNWVMQYLWILWKATRFIALTSAVFSCPLSRTRFSWCSDNKCLKLKRSNCLVTLALMF